MIGFEIEVEVEEVVVENHRSRLKKERKKRIFDI